MTTQVLKGKEKVKEEKRVRSEAEDIRTAAYYNWFARGCPPGDDLSDWVAVEQEYEEEAKSRSAHDR